MSGLEEPRAEPFASSLQHILAELERIDLLIRVQVWRARQLAEADEFQGFYISEQEVDALLEAPIGLPRWAMEPAPRSLPEVRATLDQIAAGVARRKAASARQGIVLRLDELARHFSLTSLDTDLFLACLAPEIDLRYERLYAYLQDDVTKRRPSVNLALNLLSPSFEAKLAARERFAQSAPLLKHHLLYLFDEPSQRHPPLLSRYLKVDERVVGYLFDSNEVDARLLSYTQHIAPRTRLEDLLLPDGVKHRLALLTRENGAPREGPIFYFQGPYGVGKQTTAEALCREMGMGLLVVDGERMLNAGKAEFVAAVRLAAREALLQDAVLYWDGFDALLADDGRASPADKQAHREALVRELAGLPRLSFLAGNTTWEPVDALHTSPFLRVEFPSPTYAERLALWNLALNGSTPIGDYPAAAHRRDAGQGSGQAVDLGALASRFRFSGGQIRDAAATARSLARWRDPELGQVSLTDLYAACRLQSNRRLASLAQKITPHYTWDDIVLPPDRMEQLREICNHVTYRARVYDEWGFDDKLALGKGLAVLFAGPSGTGKTMAAEIIAQELGLDLYKIDLSTVVSKYIGETEKNLARIFAEAETSNAILFFDEADALFGKRSAVRDAHDRYANIEISYLLQRMEAYEGVVILATNLRKNMDDAFVRRLQFTVEFPFPNEAERRRIWQKIWPDDVPLATDPSAPFAEHPEHSERTRQAVDLDFMARRIEIAGGNIRNIALAAAFLAASDDQVVTMSHLVHATQREFQKMGKVVAEDGFGEYGKRLR